MPVELGKACLSLQLGEYEVWIRDGGRVGYATQRQGRGRESLGASRHWCSIEPSRLIGAARPAEGGDGRPMRGGDGRPMRGGNAKCTEGL